MPVITTDVFQKKASLLLFGGVACIAALAVGEYFLFSYVAVVGNREYLTGATQLSLVIAAFFLLPAYGFFYSCHYYKTVPPLAVHSVEFQPSITGQPPMKVTFAFQWPTVYDAKPDTPVHGITPLPHLKEQLQADVGTCLNEYLASFTKTLETTHPKYLAQAVYPHLTIHFLNTLVAKPLESFAETVKISYLKYDCVAIEFPQPKVEEPPQPKDRIYL